MKIFFSRALAAATLLLASHGSALACAACYANNADDKMGHAATVGILFDIK